LVYCVLDKSLELLWRQQLSIMQQFRASAFYTVVHLHKQGDVDSECALRISIVLAICVPLIIRFGRDVRKFWQKQVGSFFGTPCTTATETMTTNTAVATTTTTAAVGTEFTPVSAAATIAVVAALLQHY